MTKLEKMGLDYILKLVIDTKSHFVKSQELGLSSKETVKEQNEGRGKLYFLYWQV